MRARFANGTRSKDLGHNHKAGEEILKIFPEGKYENQFGTVLVPVETQNFASPEKQIVEVTTYRSEQGYSDRRHPDQVIFEDQLGPERRDFTAERDVCDFLPLRPARSRVAIPRHPVSRGMPSLRSSR
jgi:hypothetical protein